MILILTTFNDKKEAKEIGKKLLNNKLIACYNLIPVESAYWWKNKIQETNEVLMIMKTNRDFIEVQKFISERHSYDVPEIVAVNPADVNKKYSKWVEEI